MFYKFSCSFVFNYSNYKIGFFWFFYEKLLFYLGTRNVSRDFNLWPIGLSSELFLFVSVLLSRCYIYTSTIFLLYKLYLLSLYVIVPWPIFSIIGASGINSADVFIFIYDWLKVYYRLIGFSTCGSLIVSNFTIGAWLPYLFKLICLLTSWLIFQLALPFIICSS